MPEEEFIADEEMDEVLDPAKGAYNSFAPSLIGKNAIIETPEKAMAAIETIQWDRIAKKSGGLDILLLSRMKDGDASKYICLSHRRCVQWVNYSLSDSDGCRHFFLGTHVWPWVLTHLSKRQIQKMRDNGHTMQEIARQCGRPRRSEDHIVVPDVSEISVYSWGIEIYSHGPMALVVVSGSTMNGMLAMIDLNESEDLGQALWTLEKKDDRNMLGREWGKDVFPSMYNWRSHIGTWNGKLESCEINETEMDAILEQEPTREAKKIAKQFGQRIKKMIDL